MHCLAQVGHRIQRAELEMVANSRRGGSSWFSIDSDVVVLYAVQGCGLYDFHNQRVFIACTELEASKVSSGVAFTRRCDSYNYLAS